MPGIQGLHSGRQFIDNTAKHKHAEQSIGIEPTWKMVNDEGFTDRVRPGKLPSPWDSIFFSVMWV